MNGLKSIAYTVAIPLLFLLKSPAHAQVASVDSLLTKAFVTDELLPILIDSATRYSPELRRIRYSEAYANANLQISKKAIYNAVSLVSSYNYGTNYSAVNNPNVITGANNFTSAQTGYYNLGIVVQVPLTSILNRKNSIKAGQSLVNMAASEQEDVALFVKGEVIKLYQDFKLSHKLMVISGKNRQAAQVNNAMAEKDFVNGQLTVEPLSRIMDIYHKSLLEFETYAGKFQLSYMQLESYTGTNLSTLIKQVK